jgi:ribonuclease R
MTIEEMARMLSLDRYDRKTIRAALELAVAERKLRRIGKTRYQWLREIDRRRGARRRGQSEAGPRGRRGAGGARVEGRYTRVRAGYGFVEVLGRAADRYRRDILVPEGMEGAALHGDRVEVEIARRDPVRRRVIGRVAAVISTAHERMIGTLKPLRHGWVLIPESDLLPPVEIVGPTAPRRQDAGLVALVRRTRQAGPSQGPAGEIEKILGAADDPEVQFLGIAFEHGLRIDFPEDVRPEAARLPADPAAADFAARRDLRDLPMVTIDGETARDFDDAVYLEPRADGGHRLVVAIADVSHYVRPGSALDREAAARGTSVYFPDRAVPMLPAELSNRLCSLNPGRERLVLAADMVLDRAGHRRQTELYRAVMRSRARLTYTRVAAVLSEAQTAEIEGWREDLSDLIPQLRLMRELMGKLYRHRVRAGSLDLDLPEALVDLSEEGRSVGVRLLQRNDAHRLIEEFMLEANRAVAAFLRDRGIPFPYRIHEPPDPDDVDELNQFLGPFGFRVDYEDHVKPADLQRLLAALDGHRLARVLSRQVLRSLTQAQYATSNCGHFGLAFPVYCHFTSPIRRYPDLLVHRQLGRVFDGREEEARAEADEMEALSVQSSQAERAAMEAERAMLDLKKAEFMLEHLLEPEAGTIVSVTSFGFFVELDAYPIEGLVRVDSLADDRYRFVEEERALAGARKRFRIGDRVTVEAVDVSLRRRQVDFALLEHSGRALPERPGRRSGRRARKVATRRRLGRGRRR